jgi:NAD(P)-dependent dehydrogenase (short-subunit alcohol dehydrogenase family)
MVLVALIGRALFPSPCPSFCGSANAPCLRQVRALPDRAEDVRLRGQGEMTALVTGAGKRLGRAMALYLAGRGHDVAVHYASSADEAEEVVAEIRAMGRKAVALPGRPAGRGAGAGAGSRRDRRPRAADRAGQQRLDLRIRPDRHRHPPKLGPAHRIEPAAPYVLTQGFARQCPTATTDEAGEPLAQGLIVNMIDQRILKLTPEFSTYTIAKMGLWALTQTAAQGLAPHVRVNAIGPGPTLRGARQTEDHFAASVPPPC